MGETIYRWNGAYAPVQGAVMFQDSTGQVRFRNKGIKRQRRELRRLEAETRNALTLEDRRRKNRMTLAA